MNKTLKNIIAVTLSNCITIVSGLIVGFLVPKMLLIQDYGLYKTFTLYTTYLGFFSLGIIDGIVLDYGGKDYEQYDRPLFRNLFRWYIVVHICFLIIICLFTILQKKNDFRFILMTLGINMVAVNINGYYQQISQITQRFKEYSLRKIIQSSFTIIVTCFLFVIYKEGVYISYNIYILTLVIVNSLLAIWYLYTYRDIIFGASIPLMETKNIIIHLVKIGFPLLFANLCSTLILTIDRQFVNLLFDTNSYALYAFAYNLLALVTIAMSAISAVLYPTLKRTTPETIKNSFPVLISIILLLSFAAISIYFPLGIFTTWFLPKYIASLKIFKIIFPGIAMSSAVTVVIHNYYKISGKSLEFFKKSIVILILSILANGFAYLIFKNTISISIASIVVMLLWYLYTEEFFVKYYNYQRKQNLLYIVIMTSGFYLIASLCNYLSGFFIYIIFFLATTFVFFRKTLKMAVAL